VLLTNSHFAIILYLLSVEKLILKIDYFEKELQILAFFIKTLKNSVPTQ
jgi:hypothetical protein